jgi:tetratricopeptide (TPR) repeat protein
LTFGTKSAAARDAVWEALHLIDGFAPRARVHAAAQRAVTADPGFAFAHYMLGRSLPGTEGRAEIQKARELAANAPEGERRYIEAIHVSLRRDKTEAIVALEGLVKDYPDEAVIRTDLAYLYLYGGLLPQARQTLEAALKLDPGSARAQASLGNLRLIEGDTAGARGCFEAALAHAAPKTAPGVAWFGLAMSHLYEGGTDAARRILRRLLDAAADAEEGAPPAVAVWDALARIDIDGGDPAAGLADVDQASSALATSAVAEGEQKAWRGRLLHTRGLALVAARRFGEARKAAADLQKVADETGDHELQAASHHLAGRLELKSGHLDAAHGHLVKIEPDNPRHLLTVAEYYEARHDEPNARKAYEALLATTANSLDRALVYPKAKTRNGERHPKP